MWARPGAYSSVGHLKGASLGQALALLVIITLDERDKYSSLLQTSVRYSRKKFYSIFFKKICDEEKSFVRFNFWCHSNIRLCSNAISQSVCVLQASSLTLDVKTMCGNTLAYCVGVSKMKKVQQPMRLSYPDLICHSVILPM